MINFENLGLKPEILRAIVDLGFENPMPVQEKVIPLILTEKRDIVALAQTGTGKTAAFGLPLVQQVDANSTKTQALILCPTRELCIQISDDINSYLKYIDDVSVLPVYGGTAIETQIRALKKGVQIIVATPGRMLDLINRKVANLSMVNTLVLDEADEMLNMGFIETLNEILKSVPENKTTMLFSATMPVEVAAISKNYMRNPLEIIVGTRNSSSENVRHICYMVNERDRYFTLKRIADYNPNVYGIVFCRTRRETQEVADRLIQDGYSADALHGDLSQAQRDYVMQKFRIHNIQLLVATDVAARGLDVNSLSHVINYNLPDDYETYNHRSGRTGRAGKKGTSVIIAGSRDKFLIKRIEKSINKTFEFLPVPKGREICERQLFNLVDKMEKVEIDNDQIDSYLPVIFKKLEWIDKEELIKRFVSTEFNRFLSYYKNAPDIVEVLDKKDKLKKKKDEKGQGRREKGRYEDNLDDYKEKKGRKAKSGFVRYRLNIGKKDGLYPNTLIEMINQLSIGKKIRVGKIDLTKKETFFEISDEYAKPFIKEMKKINFNGKKFKIDAI